MTPTRLQWWTFAAVTTAVVLAGSLVPGGGGSLVAGSDKLLHGVGYGAIAFFVAGARGQRTLGALASTAVAVALLGAGVELLQPLVGRSASVLDAVANLAGAAAGALAYELSRSR